MTLVWPLKSPPYSLLGGFISKRGIKGMPGDKGAVAGDPIGVSEGTRLGGVCGEKDDDGEA